MHIVHAGALHVPKGRHSVTHLQCRQTECLQATHHEPLCLLQLQILNVLHYIGTVRCNHDLGERTWILDGIPIASRATSCSTAVGRAIIRANHSDSRGIPSLSPGNLGVVVAQTDI